jgi:GT2 family glycosyltransferase
MTGGERLHEIPFDLYERYILLEHIGKLFRPGGSTYDVLDVGGYTEAFWPGFPSLAGVLIPDARVTVVDTMSTARLQNYIQGSRIELPFRNGAFDLVCSLDTFEHIPTEQRPLFFSEVLRVSRDGLYLAFPFDSASNRWAESMVIEHAKGVLQDPIPALLEHRHFGLPDRESVARLFADSSYPWIGFAQGNTDVWLLMMLTCHSLRMPGTDFVQELNRRFNQGYADQDWAEPHYRAGYLLSKRRGCADLEAVRESFSSAGKQADLQKVLALCQFFLAIAQIGRVTGGENRHIHNIDDSAIADVLRRLANEPASKAPAGDFDSRLSEMTLQLETLQERIDGLRSGLDFQAGLDGRMRNLEIGLVTNKRAIQAIYESRIWKALCAVGGLLQRLAGGGAVPRGESRVQRERSVADPAAQSHNGASDDFLALVCDSPRDGGVIPVRDVVEIRGWVRAESGIDRVLIQINDDPPVPASYGIPRPDVARSHPEVRDAGQSGYRFFWDPTGLPEGPCTVRVIAIARNGQIREAIRSVLIDWKTPPGYGLWIARNEPTVADLSQMRREAGNFALCPRISIAVPAYKTPPALLARCIESVVRQTYPTWELCLADDGSNDAALTALLEKYTQDDPRIRFLTLRQNAGTAGATNAALSLCSGEYVAFLDHDDELAAFALSEVVRAINRDSDTELFYSDEDKIDEQGRRYDALFKPDWSPDLFRSCNYICHLAVMKRSLVESLGGLDESYHGAQDYEFLLRASERTRKIKRIPKVLYHWRAVAGSTAKASEEKPEADADGKRALAAHLERNAPGASVEEMGACRYRVRYPIAGDPRVSILIPTGGHKNVFRALESVLEKTAYKNYDIVLIDNSRTGRVEEYVSRLAARKAPVRYFDWRGQPFNFSQMNNAAARATESPYLLFLNDDTTVVTAEWLTAMLEHAQRPEVGAVGAQLWYPSNLIQHAGVVMGIYGNCGHAFKGVPGELPHYYFDFPNLIRNCSAVTGACLLVARHKFFEAGAFDEVNLAVAFQDVDLCLKLLELGLRNVYTPYARLYHYEAATKTEKDKIPDAAEDAFMKEKWARYIADDPCYNPNLTRLREDFSLGLD